MVYDNVMMLRVSNLPSSREESIIFTLEVRKKIMVR